MNQLNRQQVTVVIFRKWKDNGDILALFPDVLESSMRCLSYEHIGQHGPADYVGCIVQTVPAKPHEYASLRKELEDIGYNLLIRTRRPTGHNQPRRIIWEGISYDCSSLQYGFQDGRATRVIGRHAKRSIV